MMPRSETTQHSPRPCAGGMCVLLAFAVGGLANLLVADDPNLGMKLAVANYQKAWQSGSKAALSQACSPKLAAAWQTVPTNAFAKLDRTPRTGTILAVTKNSDQQGSIRVRANGQTLTFKVTGSGFDWVVDDIAVLQADGSEASAREILLASSAARQFFVALDVADTKGISSAATLEFASAYNALSPKCRDHVAKSIELADEIDQPVLHTRGHRRVLTMKAKWAPDPVVLHLTDRGGWKVDDLQMVTKGLVVVSMKRSLPMMAAASEFAEFMASPRHSQDTDFAAGSLKSELEFLAGKDVQLPKQSKGKTVGVTFALEKGEMLVRHEKADVRFQFDRTGKRIEEVEITENNKTSRVSELLMTRRKWTAPLAAVGDVNGTVKALLRNE